MWTGADVLLTRLGLVRICVQPAAVAHFGSLHEDAKCKVCEAGY